MTNTKRRIGVNAANTGDRQSTGPGQGRTSNLEATSHAYQLRPRSNLRPPLIETSGSSESTAQSTSQRNAELTVANLAPNFRMARQEAQTNSQGHGRVISEGQQPPHRNLTALPSYVGQGIVSASTRQMADHTMNDLENYRKSIINRRNSALHPRPSSSAPPPGPRRPTTITFSPDSFEKSADQHDLIDIGNSEDEASSSSGHLTVLDTTQFRTLGSDMTTDDFRRLLSPTPSEEVAAAQLDDNFVDEMTRRLATARGFDQSQFIRVTATDPNATALAHFTPPANRGFNLASTLQPQPQQQNRTQFNTLAINDAESRLREMEDFMTNVGSNMVNGLQRIADFENFVMRNARETGQQVHDMGERMDSVGLQVNGMDQRITAQARFAEEQAKKTDKNLNIVHNTLADHFSQIMGTLRSMPARGNPTASSAISSDPIVQVSPSQISTGAGNSTNPFLTAAASVNASMQTSPQLPSMTVNNQRVQTQPTPFQQTSGHQPYNYNYKRSIRLPKYSGSTDGLWSQHLATCKLLLQAHQCPPTMYVSEIFTTCAGVAADIVRDMAIKLSESNFNIFDYTYDQFYNATVGITFDSPLDRYKSDDLVDKLRQEKNESVDVFFNRARKLMLTTTLSSAEQAVKLVNRSLPEIKRNIS